MAQLDACPTADHAVGSIPAASGNILSWRLVMKYFLRLFSPSADSRRAENECAQVHVLLNSLKDYACPGKSVVR